MVVAEEVNEPNGKKRPRVDSVDSGLESPESKRVRVKPEASDGCDPESTRLEGDASELGLLSPGMDKIREDLLEILTDSDLVEDRDSAIQDLDSVIKSFQDEISQPPPETASFSTPDLGYLLEASDDELGLPPATSSPSAAAEETIAAGEAEHPSAINFGQNLAFEDEFLSYDSLGLGLAEETSSGDFVAIDGLFDYGESEPSDPSEFLWQPEFLPAV